MAWDRHQHDAVTDGVKVFGRGESAPLLARRRMFDKLGPVRPLHFAVPEALPERRGVHGAARLVGGDVHGGIREVGQTPI